jgi:hypothetical protein
VQRPLRYNTANWRGWFCAYGRVCLWCPKPDTATWLLRRTVCNCKQMQFQRHWLRAEMFTAVFSKIPWRTSTSQQIATTCWKQENQITDILHQVDGAGPDLIPDHIATTKQAQFAVPSFESPQRSGQIVFISVSSTLLWLFPQSVILVVLLC